MLFCLLPVFLRTTAPPSFAGQKRAGGSTVYDYRVVNVYPHDRQAYTQGLIFSNGFLYESTGLHGASGLRRPAGCSIGIPWTSDTSAKG